MMCEVIAIYYGAKQLFKNIFLARGRWFRFCSCNVPLIPFLLPSCYASPLVQAGIMHAWAIQVTCRMHDTATLNLHFQTLAVLLLV